MSKRTSCECGESVLLRGRHNAFADLVSRQSKRQSFKDVDAGTIDERQQGICRPFRRICPGRWACEQIDVNTPQKKGAALRVLSMDVHQPVGII